MQADRVPTLTERAAVAARAVPRRPLAWAVGVTLLVVALGVGARTAPTATGNILALYCCATILLSVVLASPTASAVHMLALPVTGLAAIIGAGVLWGIW